MTTDTKALADHEFIYLQPECCADDSTGRLWCQDPDPEDCDDGEAWTKYIRYDNHLTLLEENKRLREALVFYRDDGLCQHCEGDCDEPHTDNDVCGPAACSVCGGHGRDTGQKAAQALANHTQESE